MNKQRKEVKTDVDTHPLAENQELEEPTIKKAASHKLWLATTQRALCMVIATLAYFQTGNVWIFIALLTAGFLDSASATKLIVKALKGIASDE